MTIYISHSAKMDYNNTIYIPIRKSQLNKKYTFILPYETSNMPYETKQLFESRKCDFIIAECSEPSTGQGIELGWANMLHIPILCLYQQDKKTAKALRMITDHMLEYLNPEDMIEKLTNYLTTHYPKLS